MSIVLLVGIVLVLLIGGRVSGVIFIRRTRSDDA